MTEKVKTKEHLAPPTEHVLPVPVVQVTEHSTSNNQPEGSSEDNSSFQVSISSHYSTPFDCILLAQAQELRSDVDNIKLNICSQLKTDPGQFATVTPTLIKNCNTLNKITLATGLLSLLNMSEKVCSTISGCRLPDPDPENEEKPEAVKSHPPSVEASLQAIHASLLKHKVKDSDAVESMFKSIQEQLEDLKVSLSQMRQPRKSDASTPDFLPVPVPQFQFQLESHNPTNRLNESGLISEPMPCTSSYLDEFIDDSTSEELIGFLDSHKATFDSSSENGHSVISFGQPYVYHGAKASSPLSSSFPEPITKLANLIKDKYPDSVINQCLVNRYTDQNAFLPEHSDDEKSIVHGSNIFTVSIGDTCDVTFRKKDGTNEEVVKPIKGKSMYVMSRISQAQWSHRIDTSPTTRSLRYSITFRYVSKNGSEATIIQGDSNTRHLKFGSGKGTFGDRLPGKRLLKYTIDTIEPEACIGYKNVVIHCGINDIRRPQADVRDCATRLIAKLDKISRVCKSSTKIIVSPILPTKSQHLNERAMLFNHLLFDYVNRVNPRIGCLDFNNFLDSETGLLANQYGSFRDRSDAIHLGSSGIFTLSRIIVEKIRGNVVDGRLFSNVLNLNIPTSRGNQDYHHD